MGEPNAPEAATIGFSIWRTIANPYGFIPYAKRITPLSTRGFAIRRDGKDY